MYKTNGKDPVDGALIVFFILLALFFVAAVASPALFGFFGQFDLPAKLHVPSLNNWNVLASGDLYVLSYPTLCAVSGGLTNTITIACSSESYIALMVDLGYKVSCNATTIYKGWNTARGYYGYAYIYRAKTLSCFLLHPAGGDGGGSVIIIPVSGGNN